MNNTQIYFLFQDINRILGRNKFRILTIFISRTFCGIFIYRFERALYLLFGKSYKIFRIPLVPIFSIFYWYSNTEIHYKANIKGGISIFHPSLGVVVSGEAIVGKNLTMVGGNCIGLKQMNNAGPYILGDNISLGANATIIGPLTLQHNVIIGANACVTTNFDQSNITLIGVPAKQLC